MTKPIIGITSDTSFLERTDEYRGLEINYSQKVFSDAIFQAGGIPYMIPMNAGEYVEDVMSVIDGLILIGGHDVSPLVYKQEPRKKIGTIKPDRDTNDAVLFQGAVEKGIPVLGVCRGLQLINALLGGSLHQDLSEYEGISIQHDQKAKPEYMTHSISVDQDSYTSRLVDDQSLVNSIHHQIVNELAPGLKASVWSQDKVIEAFESTEDIPLIIGVQWHPEVLFERDPAHLRAFSDLVQRAENFKKTNVLLKYYVKN